jgi:hypothetical protein
MKNTYRKFLLFLTLCGFASGASAQVVARDDFEKNEEEHPAIKNGVLTLKPGGDGGARYTVFDDDDLPNFILTLEGRLLSTVDNNCFWGVEVVGEKGKFSILCRPDSIHCLVAGSERGFDLNTSFQAPGPDNVFEKLTLRRRGNVFSAMFGKKRLGSVKAEIGALETIKLFTYRCTPEIKSYVLETFRTASAGKEKEKEDGS